MRLGMSPYYVERLDQTASHLARLFRDPQVQAQESLFGTADSYLKVSVVNSRVEAIMRGYATQGIVGYDAYDKAREDVGLTINAIREPLVTLYEQAKRKEPPKLKLWRAVSLYDIKEFNLSRVGLYWSDNRTCSSSYWSEGGDVYRITAEVDPDSVDWLATVIQRFMYGDQECEITLRPGTKVTLIEYKAEYGDTEPFPVSQRQAVAGL